MTTFGEVLFPVLTPAEIYRQLTEGSGPLHINRARSDIHSEWSEEEDRANLVASLADIIHTGWRGNASAGAYGAAMPLKERMLENAAKLDRSQDLLARQIDSFTTAANSVRPVSDPPENPLDDMFPFDTDYDKAVTDYQSAAQHNMVVFREYDGASQYNETNMPQEFDTSARSGGNVSVAAPPDTIEVGEPRRGTGEPRSDGSGEFGGPGDSGRREGGSFPGGPSPERFPGSSGVSSPGPGGGQTAPNDYRPLPAVPLPSDSHPDSGVRQPSPAPGGFVGGVPHGGYSGASGPGGGVRGGGTGGGTGGGPGGGRGISPGLGAGSGVGAGALAAEEAAARRAAQAAAGGRPGASAMGAPIGGGRGKDDEDREHERKVLIEADGEDVFGSDVLTAPQVIGDDEYED